MFVVINDQGLLYGGFCDGSPVRYRTKRAEVLMDKDTAEAVARQLSALGGKVCVRSDSHISRKWVPTELAATLDFSQTK